jgi:Flp pilus assembly protein TadG
MPADRGRAARGEDGQALVELALVAPLVLSFLLGVLLFGRILGARAALSAAAREAARVVAEAPAEDTGVRLAQQRAVDVVTAYGLAPGRFRVTIDDDGFVRGGTVTVQTSYDVPIGDLPLAGRVIAGPTVSVRAVDRERIELYRAREQ